MAGNSQRRGATRNPGSKKGAQAGTGGKNRRALEGRGPTPKAEERPHHPAGKRAASEARRADAVERHTGGRGGGGRPGTASPGHSRPGNRGGAVRRGGALPATTEVVAGRNSVVEALRASIPANTLFIADRIDTDERVREALKAAAERGLPVMEVTRGELDRMTEGSVHQGLVLKVPPYEYAELHTLLEDAASEGEAPLVVALDSVTDPRNLGAVVRSASAFGAHGVLVPERRSAGMTASAWKVSAGAAARIPVARETNLTRALQHAQQQGCFVIGLDADGDAVLGTTGADGTDAVAAVADGPLVIVVGSEGKGLSRLVRETCDLIVSIPMAASMESLNASVAASIALFEVARLRAAASRL